MRITCGRSSALLLCDSTDFALSVYGPPAQFQASFGTGNDQLHKVVRYLLAMRSGCRSLPQFYWQTLKFWPFEINHLEKNIINLIVINYSGSNSGTVNLGTFASHMRRGGELNKMLPLGMHFCRRLQETVVNIAPTIRKRRDFVIPASLFSTEPWHVKMFHCIIFQIFSLVNILFFTFPLASAIDFIVCFFLTWTQLLATWHQRYITQHTSTLSFTPHSVK